MFCITVHVRHPVRCQVLKSDGLVLFLTLGKRYTVFTTEPDVSYRFFIGAILTKSPSIPNFLLAVIINGC